MRFVRWLLLLALLGGAIAAAIAWPRVREVETGASAAYPDLEPRLVKQAPADVARQVEATIAALPGWRLLGSGSGAGGHAVQAEHRFFPQAPIGEEILVTIRATSGGSRVFVRSRSYVGPWDFGQNARNIRALFAAIDVRLPPSRKKMGESSS